MATEINSNVFYFVSDTFNNRIVQLNYEGKFVTSFGEGILSSPLGCCIWKEELIVCDSGHHRVIAFDLEGKPQRKYRVIAGKGEKGLFEARSESDTVLALTESETRSIRLIIKNWTETGKTMIVSLVGGGLFDFGFSDGLGAEAKMQHPLSCAWSPTSQNLYILDSYNNAMRIYSVGKDYLGTVPLSERLNEPSGITWFNGNLIITDTNSHRILIIHENDISQKEDIDSSNVTLVKQIFEGPFARITDYPKNNLNVNLV